MERSCDARPVALLAWPMLNNLPRDAQRSQVPGQKLRRRRPVLPEDAPCPAVDTAKRPGLQI
eukprot:6539340-Pyramimonas_sp.AAC.1